jgi:hypothetical protein
VKRRREWIACGGLTASALIAHVVMASFLGAHDPIALAGHGHRRVVALVGLTLALARGFLLVAPGWWLWLLVRLRY